MNKELQEAIKKYSLSHKEFHSHLLDKSKDNLIGMLSDLITMYINDKNSSTLREFLTTSIAGYTHLEDKIGYNGYKQSSYKKPIYCEVKPKNIFSKSNKKLNGGGNFTDYTWERFKKDKKANPNMLISGFIDGELIYIIEFPFNSKNFLSHLEEKLKQRFPNGDKKGEYLRSLSFSFKHYKNDNPKAIFKRKNLTNYEKYITKELFNFLKEKNGAK